MARAGAAGAAVDGGTRAGAPLSGGATGAQPTTSASSATAPHPARGRRGTRRSPSVRPVTRRSGALIGVNPSDRGLPTLAAPSSAKECVLDAWRELLLDGHRPHEPRRAGGGHRHRVVFHPMVPESHPRGYRGPRTAARPLAAGASHGRGRGRRDPRVAARRARSPSGRGKALSRCARTRRHCTARRAGRRCARCRWAAGTAGEAVVDLCAPCHLLWFDAFESVQLTPGATLTLFAAIRDGGAADRHPIPSRLGCPRCSAPLVPTQDLQRTTRFSYHRCPRGHGRLTPFVQFLREKDFIRPLPPAEIARLAAHAAVIRCSGCGAPVDLARDTACGHCGAPIAILDPDAMARTIGALENGRSEAHHHRRRRADRRPCRRAVAPARTRPRRRASPDGRADRVRPGRPGPRPPQECAVALSRDRRVAKDRRPG